jgi:uncharacterized protein GlcG (DUF336 family)
MSSRMPPRLVSIIVALGLSSALTSIPAFADDLLTTHRLSAELASAIASEGVASCQRQGYAETIVVVDADGVRQAVLRGDRAGSHSLDSANDKAYTAASFKSDTSARGTGEDSAGFRRAVHAIAALDAVRRRDRHQAER